MGRFQDCGLWLLSVVPFYLSRDRLPGRFFVECLTGSPITVHCAPCSSRRGEGRPCQLVISDTSVSDVPRTMYIFQRWLPLVLTIHGAPCSRSARFFERDPKP